MVALFTDKDKKELREAAFYAAMLPPRVLWQQFKKTLAEDAAHGIEMYWDWLGGYLDTFFADKPNILPDSNSSKCWQALIEVSGTYYIQLALVIFQGERFLKAEFKHQTACKYPFKRRSDLLKRLMLEDCISQLELHLEGYVSPAAAQWLDRLHTAYKYMNEEISRTQLERYAQKALQEDSKRNNLPLSQGYYFWNLFCQEVFYKHRKAICNYQAYAIALDGFRKLYTSRHSPRYGEAKQIAAINGRLVPYPGRGKGKKSK